MVFPKEFFLKLQFFREKHLILLKYNKGTNHHSRHDCHADDADHACYVHHEGNAGHASNEHQKGHRGRTNIFRSSISCI